VTHSFYHTSANYLRFNSKGLPFDSNGPDESQIRELLERTGYDLTISTGQRKYGGPPPEWDGTVPSKNCEVNFGFSFLQGRPGTKESNFLGILWKDPWKHF